jgi:hypothetical protein
MLWSGDLADGGSPNVTPGLTRKSIVSHYCPLNCAPVYAAGARKSSSTRYNDVAYYTCAQRD